MELEPACASLLGALNPKQLLAWAEQCADGPALSARLEGLGERARVQAAARALKYETQAGPWVALARLLPDRAAEVRALAEANGAPWPVEAPEPGPELVGASPEVRGLSLRLEQAYARLDAVGQRGEDTAEIRAEILDLRRALRGGPGLSVGERLGEGRWCLTERLGQGGFAVVWAAWDRQLRRSVAIKVLHAQHAHDADRLQRFFRGARLMAELHHAGVVRVLESRREDEGRHFFVMERLVGGDLHQAIKQGRLSRERALDAVLEVGAALTFAHARGVVHRDVKPQNILLDGQGRATLTDFDLVKAEDTTGGTRSGALGTFLYAAPEAMRAANSADPRADVFSLAMSAVFCVHGDDIPAEALYEREAFLAGLRCTEALRRVLVRGTAIRPDARYPDIEAFCTALQAARLVTEASEDPAQREEASPYASLRPYLGAVPIHLDQVALSFEVLERVWGGPLPYQARSQRAWWSNDPSNPQARSWLDVGWRVGSLNVTRGQVGFTRIDARSKAYIQFFGAVLQHLRRLHPTLEPLGSPNGSNGHVLFTLSPAGHAIGNVGVSFARSGQLRVELYLDTGDQDSTKALFYQLEENRERIEGSLDLRLSWEVLEDRRGSRIAFYLPGRLDDPPERLRDLAAAAALHAGAMFSVFRRLLY